MVDPAVGDDGEDDEDDEEEAPVEETEETKVKIGFYVQTLMEWYPDFFGPRVDAIVAEHRAALTRLGLLRVPKDGEIAYHDMFRKFSVKLVKIHTFPQLFAYFRFVHDKLTRALDDKHLLLRERNRPSPHEAAFDLFPKSKHEILHVRIDVKILEWLVKQSGIAMPPKPFRDPFDWWNFVFDLRELRLKRIPASISFQTDGVMASVTYDKNDKKDAMTSDTDSSDDDSPPDLSNRKRARKKVPHGANKRQKQRETAKAVKTSFWSDEETLPRTGLIHIRQINSRKNFRKLNRRFEKGGERVIGNDPGAKDAMTVVRSDDISDNFRVPSAWWYDYFLEHSPQASRHLDGRISAQGKK